MGGLLSSGKPRRALRSMRAARIFPRLARLAHLARVAALSAAACGACACQKPAGAPADAGAAAVADDAGAAATGAALAATAAQPAAAGADERAAAEVPSDRPLLGVTAFVATVYKEPRDTSKKLGYLRVGARVPRAAEPAGTAGCPGGWYAIEPRGFLCVGEDATLDLDDPILKAAGPGPNLRTALPYKYAFVRAVLPLYLRVPTAEEQRKSEFKLDEHLAWFEENKATVQRVVLGANDVAIDERGVPLPGKQLGELGLGKNSLELGEGALLGGAGENDPIPFWLEGGKRVIRNISDFKVPDYAVFADRARRFTGLSLIGSFPTGPESLNRRFAITTDLRLAPATKIKPDTGSPWHGVELNDQLTLPLAFVRARGARDVQIQGDRAAPGKELPFRDVIPLTGRMRRLEGVKYYRTRDQRYVSQLDVGLAVAPSVWPEVAEKGEKWIEVSIQHQTLVLWEGKRPVYATLVSTGQAGVADPKTTTATVRGIFRIRNKHITATMDSNESSSVGGRADTTADAPSASRGAKPDKGGSSKERAAKKPGASAAAKPAEGQKASPRKGDGEYGVTRRRGEGTYALKDVPYIQYFASGYALHAAYWHDVFGTPRSHGCINMSPIDAHRVFLWTEPRVPPGWHAINTGEELGEGTTIIVHE
ncbi:L,D-transpeptidase [Sorangium sp. So ce1099]|uniref:L,D-transpeptidase n=1 Tax=Sorangium sp. So ce1099 TaxID=3133331 RepID=UPI003F6455A8